MITSEEFEAVVGLIGRYDLPSVAAGLGALQLMPENAGSLLRLELAAEAVICCSETGGRPEMSLGRWRKFVTRPPLATSDMLSQEDPFNDLFTQEMVFRGGGYTLFSGLEADSVHILRELSKALFLTPSSILPASTLAAMDRVIRACLAVSDGVARKAGSGRGQTASEFKSDITFPTPSRFKSLMGAVAFSASELNSRLADHGVNVADLERITVLPEATRRPAAPWDADSWLSTQRPLLRTEGRYTLCVPGGLATAARHAVLNIASEDGILSAVGEAYRAALAHTCRSALTLMGCQLQTVLPSDPTTQIGRYVFSLDRDKVLHLAVVSDDLAGFDPSSLGGTWAGDELARHIVAVLLDAERELCQRASRLNDILHVVVIGSLGRQGVLGFNSQESGLAGRLLVMTPRDLETIALIEGDGLGLLYFAQASDNLRETARVLVWNLLDEYDIYRKTRHGYYYGDHSRPTAVNIALGGAREMYEEVFQRFDFHAAPFIDSGATVEVAKALGTSEPDIPVFCVPRPIDRVCMLAEGASRPIWIVSQQEEPKPIGLYLQVAEMLAVWLARFAPILGPEWPGPAGAESPLVVYVDLQDPNAWRSQKELSSDPLESGFRVTRVSAERVELLLRPSVLTHWMGPTNAAELAIMADVAAALDKRALGDSSPGRSDVIRDAVLGAIPASGDKRLIVDDVTDDPRLQDRRLPKGRRVQEGLEEPLLDGLGDVVADRFGLIAGPIATDMTGAVLKHIVAHLFERLGHQVRQLSADGLLETLVSQHEAILSTQAHSHWTLPARVAGERQRGALVARLEAEVPEWDRAALANRFLIEYVTGQPPSGIRPISLTAYDSLCATVSQLIGWGWDDDLRYAGIYDVRLNLLLSGRIGTNRHAYLDARDRFINARAESLYAAGLQRSLPRDPPPVAFAPGDLQADVEAATEAEFGVSLTTMLTFMAGCIEVGTGTPSEPKILPVDQFVNLIAQTTSMDLATIHKMLAMFALGPRDNFLNAAPFDPSDIYPWRFNRRLSYVRRPLLLRCKNGELSVIWGQGTIYVAAGYLADLCLGGRLRAQSLAMKQVASRIQNRVSREFNDAVGSEFAALPDHIVCLRVSKVNGRRIESAAGLDLGDIDVLVADRRHRRILVVEAKDYSAARTPVELGNELEALFGPSGGLARHARRAAWVRDNLAETLRWLGITAPQSSGWRVAELIVVDQPIMSAYLLRARVPIIPLRDVRGYGSRAVT